MDIGTLMRDARDRAALTQVELARRSGLSQSTVSAVERGARQPSLTVVGQLLAALGLQLGLATEPAEEPEADLDAAIDAALRTPPAERLTGRWFDGPALLRMLAPVTAAVEGPAGAVLHGAPVPVSWIDVVVERSRLEDLRALIQRTFAERWSEVWRQWGMESSDPRWPGPLRWLVGYGEFRVRLVDETPETVTILVGDLPVPVRPLTDIEAGGPQVRRALARLRRRTHPAGREPG